MRLPARQSTGGRDRGRRSLARNGRDTKDAWERGRVWSSLVNPGRPDPGRASGIHHITDDMVKDAPKINELHEEIVRGLDGGHLCAHEAKFEKACLPQFAPLITICTRKCAATLWPDAPDHKNQTMRYWLGLKLSDPALATPHRAAGDAYVTAALLRRCLQHATVDELIDCSARPVLLSKFWFGEHAMKPISDIPEGYLSWITGKDFDEDVLYTARCELADRRAPFSVSQQRARSHGGNDESQRQLQT
jgi:exodeoxyribonuclease X